jgi:hypothetical protein
MTCGLTSPKAIDDLRILNARSIDTQLAGNGSFQRAVIASGHCAFAC